MYILIDFIQCVEQKIKKKIGGVQIIIMYAHMILPTTIQKVGAQVHYFY